MPIGGALCCLTSVRRPILYAFKLPFCKSPSLIKVGRSGNTSTRMNAYHLPYPFGFEVIFVLVFEERFKHLREAENKLLESIDNEYKVDSPTRPTISRQEWLINYPIPQLQKRFLEIKKLVLDEWEIESFLLGTRPRSHFAEANIFVNKRNQRIPHSVELSRKEVELNQRAVAKFKAAARIQLNAMSMQNIRYLAGFDIECEEGNEFLLNQLLSEMTDAI